MAKYLVTGSYTSDGLKGLLKEGGSGRRKAVEAAVKSMGGHLEAYYFAFGDSDVITIVDVPDNVTAAALAIGISSTGTVGTRTTVLLTAEEIDQATKKSLSFRPAGGSRRPIRNWQWPGRSASGCFGTWCGRPPRGPSAPRAARGR